MAGIGEYVHLKQDNYKKFGIGRTEQRGMSFTQSYNQAKNELLGRIGVTIPKVNLIELEKRFNEVRSNLGKNASQLQTGGTSDDVLDQYFINQVDNYFEEKQHMVDYNTLDVQSAGSVFSQAKMTYNSKRKTEDPYFQSRTWKNFKNKFILGLQQIQLALSQGLITSSQAKSLDDDFKIIQTQMNTLDQAIALYGIKPQYSKMISLFDQYNSILAKYTLPSKKELGDLGEFFALYAALKVGNTSQKEIKKLFMEGFKNPVGAKGSVTTYDFSGLIDQNELNLPFFNYQENDGGRNFNVSINTSQDTIDIAVDFIDGPLLASVKNVNNINNPHGIKILDGAPLTALFNLVNTDFVNHYMNILSFSQNYGKQIEQANEIWKKAAVVRGLSGARNSSNSYLANTFIVNQRTGSIKIFSIAELLNRVLRLTKNVEDYAEITGNNFPPNKIENKKVGEGNDFKSAGIRITKIFNELHKIKLRVSLLPSALI